MYVMIMINMILATLAAAQPMAQPTPGNASIDFVNSGGIRDWHADDDRGIYLRDSANRWYYAAFRYNCPGVLYNPRIAFDTDGFSRFDRSSRVVTEIGVCALESVDRSPAPAAKGGRSASR